MRPGSGSPDGSDVGVRGFQNLCAGSHHQHRLAVPILILDELEHASVDGQRLRRLGSVAEDRDVEEHRRQRLDAGVDLQCLAGRRVDRTKARAEEARHGPSLDQRGGECLQRRGFGAIGNQDGDAPPGDATFAWTRHQRQ